MRNPGAWKSTGRDSRFGLARAVRSTMDQMDHLQLTAALPAWIFLRDRHNCCFPDHQPSKDGFSVLRNQRVGITIASVVLSLPALATALLGGFFIYAFAVLGGYNGTPLQAVVNLLSSWKGFLAMIPVFLIIGYIAVFIYLLSRFARGLPLPLLAQIYCMTIVILAIGERIRLQIVDGNALFWFGVFSLPHVFCLFVIIWISAKWLRPGVPYREQSEFG